MPTVPVFAYNEEDVACIMAGDEAANSDTCFTSLRAAIADEWSTGKTVYLIANDHASFTADNLELTINKEVTMKKARPTHRKVIIALGEF